VKLVHAACVESFTSQDGRRQLGIFKRNDGLYEFRSEELVHDEFEGAWWKPTIHSGLYDTLENARHDALSRAPWIADAASESGDSS
jgi:hypothetical protein